MSIRKKWLVIASTAVLLLGTSIMAQDAEDSESAEDVVTEEEAAPEEAAAPEPAYTPEPAPVEVAAAPAPEAPKADKPKVEVTPYGTASYRFRGRLWSASTEDDKSGFTADYFNLLGWQVGLKAKVDDKLSLQFQIGNDFNSGEEVSWAANNANGARQSFQNLYVHLAYATWNPGPVYLTGGVIPVSSNGTLDLLERSLNTGSYGDAIFQTWSSVLNNRLVAIKLGVPLLKDDFKLGVELTSSVLDARSTRNNLIGNYATTGAVGKDDGVTEEPDPNPPSVLLLLDVPISAGALKLTPELTYVLNRNYNSTVEKGDGEFIVGLAGSYKINDGVTLSLSGAYGTVSNKESQIGTYGGNTRGGSVAKVDNFQEYVSNGLIVGVGTSIKAGPGSLAIDAKYGNAIDAANDATEKATNKNDILGDIRYTWNVHPKFSIQPRYRLYVTTYDEGSGHISTKMENRPELILTGSF